MNELIIMLRQLEATKFYGAVEIKFEAGHVIVIRKTESIKPGTGNYRNSRGGENATTRA
jgi:hypothetical protein